MTLGRVWMPSPHYSSRGGSGVRLAVIHTAEGALTIGALGNFFADSDSGVSSHTGIDDTPNVVGEYVNRTMKSWTAAAANPYAVQAELCAFASWDRATWLAHPTMLANTTAWLREECAAFGIPWIRLTAAQAQDGRSSGICGHADLGYVGASPGSVPHWDPGPSFPWDVIMNATPPAPPVSVEVENMVLQDPDSGGYWVIGSDYGGVFTYDGAPYLGATNNEAMNAGRYPCAGIARFCDHRGEGYTIILDWGDDGTGHAADGGDRFRRYTFPRDGSGNVAG